MDDHPKHGPRVPREPPCTFRIAPHRPRLYRYRVADAGFRVAPNRYGSALIGLALVAGRFAYCVKWADAAVAR